MIKTYPVLYALTSTGATQIWFMEQDGEKFRSTSGQKDGQKVVSDWTEAKPKNVGRANVTTAEEQASAEIKSKYDKQLKSGGYWENESDINKERFFQVMLAKNFDDYKDDIDWNQGVAVQIKYNGGRIIARKSGLFTRKGEKYISIPHIEEALIPFFNKFPDAILDGEGFNYTLRERLNEIMSLLNKKVRVTPQDLAKSKEMIKFYVYDGFGFPSSASGSYTTIDSDYLCRKAAIDNAFFAPCFRARYDNIIGRVPTWVVKSYTELNTLYQKFLADNQEGGIIRILGKPYETKRSRYLLKYKPVDDDEFRILSVQDGKGKFANRIATVTCEKLDRSPYLDGETTFDATFKGTERDAFKAWDERQNLVGKVVTIYYNATSGYGKPNYPRFDWLNYNKGH